MLNIIHSIHYFRQAESNGWNNNKHVGKHVSRRCRQKYLNGKKYVKRKYYGDINAIIMTWARKILLIDSVVTVLRRQKMNEGRPILRCE